MIPFYPRTRTRRTTLGLVDQQRAAANRTRNRDMSLVPRDLAKMPSTRELAQEQDASQLRLYHWPSWLIEIALFFADKLCETTMGLQDDTTSQAQRQLEQHIIAQAACLSEADFAAYLPPACAYTGWCLCHLPRSLIKRRPNSGRGDEVRPAG